MFSKWDQWDVTAVSIWQIRGITPNHQATGDMNYSLVFCLQARRGQTTIIIAHRLSTAQTADVIAGIVDGAVVEMGTHTELMEKKEPYYSLATSQVHLLLLLLLFVLS